MATQTHDDHPTKPTPWISPFPSLGGLYMIVAGIVLGVLLSQAVLGRFAPSIYEDAFVGGAEQREMLDANQATLKQQAQTLEEIGVTDAAIPEHLLQIKQQEIAWQVAKEQHLTTLAGWTTSLMLAVIAVMIIESLMSPDTSDTTGSGRLIVSPALGRLITARYALCAVWIAITIAQPRLVEHLPIVFAGLLVVVAVAAALVPLGPGRKAV